MKKTWKDVICISNEILKKKKSEMSKLVFKREDDDELESQVCFVPDDDDDIDESRPPTDGLDYLKRVMKEAKKINVTIGKVFQCVPPFVLRVIWLQAAYTVTHVLIE